MSNDDTQPTSGSRWEQPAPEQPAPDEPAPQPPAPEQSAAPVPAYAPAPQSRNRGRLLLAGGAVGIGLVAGTAGFALGHATADDGHDGMERLGGPGGFHGNFPAGPGGGPMGGQQNGPPGTFPGQPGQPPDGFGDRDGDDDQQLPDDGATEGSTSNS